MNNNLCVLDDDSGFLKSLEKKFVKFGIQSYILSDKPQEVLDLVKEHQCGLLASDLFMPKMNGIAVLEEAKRLDNFVQLCLLTGEPVKSSEKDKLIELDASILRKSRGLDAITMNLKKRLDKTFRDYQRYYRITQEIVKPIADELITELKQSPEDITIYIHKKPYSKKQLINELENLSQIGMEQINSYLNSMRILKPYFS